MEALRKETILSNLQELQLVGEHKTDYEAHKTAYLENWKKYR
jgi:hypothetical protein